MRIARMTTKKQQKDIAKNVNVVVPSSNKNHQPLSRRSFSSTEVTTTTDSGFDDVLILQQDNNCRQQQQDNNIDNNNNNNIYSSSTDDNINCNKKKPDYVKVKKYIKERFESTSFGDSKAYRKLPTFDKMELQLGERLGIGNFSYVDEIKFISLQDIAITKQKQQRKMMKKKKKQQQQQQHQQNNNNEDLSFNSDFSDTLTLLQDDGDDDQQQQQKATTPKSGMRPKCMNKQKSNKFEENRQFIATHCIRESGDSRYALKCLRRDVRDSNDMNKLSSGLCDLAVEAKFLATLDYHPNIIKIRAVSSCGPYSIHNFLVLDRLYDTLAIRLNKWSKIHKQSKKLINKIKQRIITPGTNHTMECLEDRIEDSYSLAGAIAYLHDQKIIHRDIKPENIGYDVRDDIKIFDFGMARELPDDKKNDDGTYRLSNMTGTLRYMAPEVGLGKPYNTCCDVYSYTILLWEIISLEQPYNGLKRQNEFVNKVFYNHLRPTINTMKWSKSIQNLFLKNWSFNINDRMTMHSIHEILRDELIHIRNGDDSGLLSLHSRNSYSRRRRSTYIFEHTAINRSCDNFSSFNSMLDLSHSSFASSK